MAKVFGWLPDKYSEMWSLIAYGCLVITGRNEVVAKVIFLHLSVIHSVHRGGGGLPQCMLGYHHPPRPGRPPRTRQTPSDQADAPQTRQTPPRPGRHPPPRPGRPHRSPPDQADPPGKQTPAYGLRAAGTHPTGMHSCFSARFL